LARLAANAGGMEATKLRNGWGRSSAQPCEPTAGFDFERRRTNDPALADTNIVSITLACRIARPELSGPVKENPPD